MMRLRLDDSSQSEPQTDDAIDRELEQLGESPADDDEVRFHRAGADPRADVDVATIATLVSIGHDEPDRRPLSQIEDRRVWNRVADRLEAGGAAVLTRAVAGRSVWRSVVAGLAMAAGVALIPRLVPDGPAANTSRTVDADAMGEAAKSGLQSLGDDYDTQRARGVLSDYAARMQQERRRR